MQLVIYVIYKAEPYIEIKVILFEKNIISEFKNRIHSKGRKKKKYN